MRSIYCFLDFVSFNTNFNVNMYDSFTLNKNQLEYVNLSAVKRVVKEYQVILCLPLNIKDVILTYNDVVF